MGNTPLRIIQISDTHLYGDAEKTLLGVNSHESFRAVLDLLQTEAEKMDLILLSGDLSQDGSSASYIYMAEQLKPFNVPVYFIPGNHDNAEVMSQVYPRDTISNNKHIILNNWHMILLNSQVPGSIHGHLDQSQLDYLRQCLQADTEREAIIVFHHQPVSVGSHWLDNLGLKNDHEFWQVIADYSSVNTVLFGHVHQEYEQLMNGIKCYSTPATCFQFKRNQDHFGIEKLPPGYRWVHLYEDGSLKTGVKRTADYVGKFEADAKGY